MEKFQNLFGRGFNAASENPSRSGAFFKRASIVTAVAVSLGFAQLPHAQAVAPAPARISLGATVVAIPAAAFIDSDGGTAVSVTISTLTGVTDQDVLYLGLTNGSGNVVRRIIVTPGPANNSGAVTTASASFVTTTFGAQTYRLWADRPDAVTGLRNRTWDNSANLNEPVSEGTFNFAGNPTTVSLADSEGVALGENVSVNEGTCKVFQATVKDVNATPIRNQQLSISFENGVLGSKPQACSATDLNAANQAAATSLANGVILTGSTSNQGVVKFAIKGSKGAPAWAGSVTAKVVDPLADANASASFTLSTNPGGNNAVSSISVVAPSTAPRLSSTSIALTVTDQYGKPLQGVVLSVNPSPSPTAGTDLLPTDMAGKTSYRVDTSVLGVQAISIWANRSGQGATSGINVGEISTITTVAVVPQLVDTSASTFTAASSVVPTDSVSVPLTLTVNDSSGNPVKDVQVDFAVPSPSPNAINLSSTSGVTDSLGKVVVTASRSATLRTRQVVRVTGTIRNSNPTASISVTFEIQPRAASQIALISQSEVSTTNAGTARIEVALQDQFGGPFAGTVGFRSTSGRNLSVGYANTVTTDAAGHAVVNFLDTKGSGAQETDSVVAEALTVDSALISSDPVTIHYYPSLAAGSTTQLGLPVSYNLLYGNAAKQSVFNVVATLKNTTADVERKLYAVPAHLTVSGPANFTPSGTTLDLVSDNSGQVSFGVLPTGAAGIITVSLTSGGATKVWTVQVIPSGDGARTISVASSVATAKSGATSRFTATVKDVFGNLLPNVRVTFISSGVGLLNSGSVDQCAGVLGTSDSTYAVAVSTSSNGQAWTDLRTSPYDAGTARVSAYIGNPFNNGCQTNYAETSQLADAPFVGALAGNVSGVASVAYTADTTLADTLASIVAAQAAAQAAADKAAADKAAAQALATQAAADKAAAQALATGSATDKAVAQALAAQATSDRAAAQAAAAQAAADKAAAQALATGSAADKAAAQALATQAAADKADATKKLAAAKKAQADAAAKLKAAKAAKLRAAMLKATTAR
jgi:hypothetical protein